MILYYNIHLSYSRCTNELIKFISAFFLSCVTFYEYIIWCLYCYPAFKFSATGAIYWTSGKLQLNLSKCWMINGEIQAFRTAIIVNSWPCLSTFYKRGNSSNELKFTNLIKSKFNVLCNFKILFSDRKLFVFIDSAQFFGFFWCVLIVLDFRCIW